MQRIRFFEDSEGEGGAARLLLGIAVEGFGEAVRLATVDCGASS